MENQLKEAIALLDFLHLGSSDKEKEIKALELNLNRIETQVDRIRYAMYPEIRLMEIKKLLDMFDRDSGKIKNI